MGKEAYNRLDELIIIKKVEEYGMKYICREYIKKENKKPTLLITCSDINGYKYRLYYNTIKKKLVTSPFRKSNIYSMENMEKYLKENNREIICLEIFVKNKQSHGRFKCLVDGYVWVMPIYNAVIFGRGCPYCSKRHKLTVGWIQEEFNKLGIDFKIINMDKNEKIGVHDRILVKCIHCDYVFETCLNTIRITNQTCKNCCQDFGVYTIKNAEKHKTQWSNIDGVVYVIKCISDNDEPIFYKIGMTKNNVKTRFSWDKTKQRMPYKYEVLHEISNTLYNCVYLERELHKLNICNKYSPKKKFGGHTECFSSLGEEVMKCIQENI